jgi:holo-[acyl-carrier protein] synthase
MRIVGHGVDLVEVSRVAHLLEAHGARFMERCFTAAERDYADQSIQRRAEHYAARFAAKEAILKALGTGWRNGISWSEMEVVRHPSGQPGVRLTGRCAEIAASQGVGDWLLSLSHTAQFAIGSAIALGSR